MDDIICLSKDANVINIVYDRKKETKKKYIKNKNIIEQRIMVTNGEKWKHIPGFDSYLISDSGNVYSTKSGKTLSPFHLNNGYYVKLYHNELYVNKELSFLVAQCFLGLTKNKEIIHLDNNNENNKIENLKIVPRKYNKSKKHTKKQIIYIFKNISPSIVDRKMKDGSIKRYIYSYYSISYRIPTKKIVKRVFNTKIRADDYLNNLKNEFKINYSDYLIKYKNSKYC